MNVSIDKNKKEITVKEEVSVQELVEAFPMYFEKDEEENAYRILDGWIFSNGSEKNLIGYRILGEKEFLWTLGLGN